MKIHKIIEPKTTKKISKYNTHLLQIMNEVVVDKTRIEIDFTDDNFKDKDYNAFAVALHTRYGKTYKIKIRQPYIILENRRAKVSA